VLITFSCKIHVALSDEKVKILSQQDFLDAFVADPLGFWKDIILLIDEFRQVNSNREYYLE
jgi:hypothetical protein